MKLIACIVDETHSDAAIEELLSAGVEILRYRSSERQLETRMRRIRDLIERRGFKRKVKVCIELCTADVLSRALSPEWVSIPTVSSAADVKRAKHLLVQSLGYYPTVISEIGTREGVSAVDEIAAASDLLMVDRDTLMNADTREMAGVCQRAIIRAGRRAGKQVIVPTSGDVFDVTSIVFDGVYAMQIVRMRPADLSVLRSVIDAATQAMHTVSR